MTIVLLVLIVVLLAGGGMGWRNDYWGYGNPVGLVLLVLLVVIVFSLIGGHRWGYL